MSRNVPSLIWTSIACENTYGSYDSPLKFKLDPKSIPSDLSSNERAGICYAWWSPSLYQVSCHPMREQGSPLHQLPDDPIYCRCHDQMWLFSEGSYLWYRLNNVTTTYSVPLGKINVTRKYSGQKSDSMSCDFNWNSGSWNNPKFLSLGNIKIRSIFGHQHHVDLGFLHLSDAAMLLVKLVSCPDVVIVASSLSLRTGWVECGILLCLSLSHPSTSRMVAFTKLHLDLNEELTCINQWEHL